MSSIEKKRIALFPGTFDPFTIGHQSLVERGLALVDEIVISIGIVRSVDGGLRAGGRGRLYLAGYPYRE